MRRRLRAERPGRVKDAGEDDRHRQDRVRRQEDPLPHVRRGRAEVRAQKVDPLLRQRHHGPLHHGTLGVRSGKWLWDDLSSNLLERSTTHEVSKLKPKCSLSTLRSTFIRSVFMYVCLCFRM